ncbi:MAG: sigma-70 family RNA polymerase sigma factor [Anaerolineae bacterium]|nr:sigma-70 family RNA polymerase sigma factor [Anaerolineae bacterium]
MMQPFFAEHDELEDEVDMNDPVAWDDDDDQVVMGMDFLSMYLMENRGTALLTAAEEVHLAKQMELGRAAAQKLQRSPLTPSQHEELRQIVHEGEEARAALTQANVRLVINIAKRYRDQGLDFLDLIQEGNVGLITAVDKFDYTMGNRFSTYATWWIRQSITRAISNHAVPFAFRRTRGWQFARFIEPNGN